MAAKIRGCGALVAAPALGLLGCGESSSEPAPPPTASGSADCSAAVAPLGADPALGHSYPDLEWTTCDGSSITVDEVRCRARVTLVGIGAGWCQPCRAEAPLLEAAQAAWADQGVQAVQVLIEDTQSQPATTLFCRQWRDELDLTIGIYVDPVARSTEPFEDFAVPTTIAVDHSGRVLWAESELPSDLDATIGELLDDLP